MSTPSHARKNSQEPLAISACLHPGCMQFFITPDHCKEHAAACHPGWLETLTEPCCMEVAQHNGLVTLGMEDGSICDGSAARPFHLNAKMHMAPLKRPRSTIEPEDDDSGSTSPPRKPRLSQEPVVLPTKKSDSNEQLLNMTELLVHAAIQPAELVEIPETGLTSRRSQFSAWQLERLQREFQQSELPNKERRERIAAELGVTERSVKIWFQNRRQRGKPHAKEKAAAAPTVPPSYVYPVFACGNQPQMTAESLDLNDLIGLSASCAPNGGAAGSHAQVCA